ncbi:MAG: hypothetical protein JSV49_04085, partial [Thermoplasmata archaeon]
VEVYSNAEDFQDLEKQLLPHFEYMGPNHTSWQTDLNSPPEYKGGRWQTVFSIPVNATLGYYEFRVRYNDTDDMWSPWCYLNGSFRVLNNPPEMDYFDISKTSVEIGESFILFVNGTDVEDDLQKLTFEFEYKHSDDSFWNPLSFEQKKLVDSWWEYNMTFNNTMDWGYYNLRAMVYDSDLGYSDWRELEDRLLVNPAKPRVISINLSKHEIYRKDSLVVYINCTDPDSLADFLDVELQYISVLEKKWYDLSPDLMDKRWEADMDSKSSWSLGIYNFRARVTDPEENTNLWFYLNNSLRVLNNIPEIVDIIVLPENIHRNESAIISIDANDVENADDLLEVELEYRIPGGVNWVTNYISRSSYSDNYWHFEFAVPYDAPLGAYSLRARVRDLDDAWSEYSYLNDSLVVNNSIPKIISLDQEPNVVYRTGTIQITADALDLETVKENLECIIYYQEPFRSKWHELSVGYNKGSDQWHSELITTINSKLGNYSFKVQFIDEHGAISNPVFSNYSVWVRNNLPVISEDLDDIEVGSLAVTITLTDYGYDVETPSTDLIWEVDTSSVDRKLFNIDNSKLGEQKLVIIPVSSKSGNDDITVILADADGGTVIKSNITINVNSIEGEKPDVEEEKDDIQAILKDNNYIIFIFIIIIITLILILFYAFYRKRKRGEEDKSVEVEEETVTMEKTEGELPGVTESAEPLPETTTPTPAPVPVVEPPEVPTPVPMPVEEPKPQLPPPTQAAPAEPPVAQPVTEPELVPEVQPQQPQPEPKIADSEKEIMEEEKN